MKAALNRSVLTSAFKALQNPCRAALASTVIVACLTLASTSQAAIVFQFDYADPANFGFNDSAQGASRRAALLTAGNLFSDMFSSHFSNAGSIHLKVTSTFDPMSGSLATAGSYTSGNPGFGNDIVRLKLQTGNDLTGAFPEGETTVNWGRDFQLDPNGPAGGMSGLLDFYSVMMHEFTHAIAFTSSVALVPDATFGNRTEYDRFWVDQNGVSVWNPDETLNASVFNAAIAGGFDGQISDPGLYFGGANAVAGHGGTPVKIWGGHLDWRSFPGFLMNPFIQDPGVRDYSPTEVGILQDIGYTPVPEPASILLLALGGAAMLMRRRRS